MYTGNSSPSIKGLKILTNNWSPISTSVKVHGAVPPFSLYSLAFWRLGTGETIHVIILHVSARSLKSLLVKVSLSFSPVRFSFFEVKLPTFYAHAMSYDATWAQLYVCNMVERHRMFFNSETYVKWYGPCTALLLTFFGLFTMWDDIV
jgi:hypothetical protein